MRFKDRFAIVTGAASGIGRATALQLINEGAVVFGLDKKEDTNAPYHHFVCDVSDEEQVKAVINRIQEYTAKIDYLANVAGVLGVGSKSEIKHQSIEDWEAVLRINLNSVLIMTKNVYPLLKNSDCGSIVNMSSDQSFKVNKAMAPYIVSKLGINALTKISALELAEDKIRVNAVAAGPVRTNILKDLVKNEDIINKMNEETDKSLPFGMAEPEDISSLICYLLSDQAKRISGQIMLVDSGKQL